MPQTHEQIAQRLINRLKQSLLNLTGHRHKNPYVENLVNLLSCPVNELDTEAIELAYRDLRKNIETFAFYIDFQEIGLCMEILMGWF